MNYKQVQRKSLVKLQTISAREKFEINATIIEYIDKTKFVPQDEGRKD